MREAQDPHRDTTLMVVFCCVVFTAVGIYFLLMAVGLLQREGDFRDLPRWVLAAWAVSIFGAVVAFFVPQVRPGWRGSQTLAKHAFLTFMAGGFAWGTWGVFTGRLDVSLAGMPVNLADPVMRFVVRAMVLLADAFILFVWIRVFRDNRTP